MIKDTYDRIIDYVRISVTDRCNLRCRYCMPEDIPLIPHQEILRYEEILRLSRIFAAQGIRKVKVTGGEPLVRLGCVDFIRQLKQIEGIENVTLTTNGVLLSKYLPELIAAGIDGINVSLDTLRPERFRKITGKDEFDHVWRGIEGALAAGVKIKLNCVPIIDNNADEIVDFFELARKHRIDVRFIEMMPIGYGKNYQPIPTYEILEKLKNCYQGIYEIREKRGNGPAVYYENRDFAGCVGFIGAVHQQFCSTCNRIRLTSEGFLKPCLYYNQGIDLRKMLRGGAEDEKIARAVRGIIRQKPKEHRFACQTIQTIEGICDGQPKNGNVLGKVFDEEDARNMSQIGG